MPRSVLLSNYANEEQVVRETAQKGKSEIRQAEIQWDRFYVTPETEKSVCSVVRSTSLDSPLLFFARKRPNAFTAFTYSKHRGEKNANVEQRPSSVSILAHQRPLFQYSTPQRDLYGSRQSLTAA